MNRSPTQRKGLIEHQQRGSNRMEHSQCGKADTDRVVSSRKIQVFMDSLQGFSGNIDRGRHLTKIIGSDHTTSDRLRKRGPGAHSERYRRGVIPGTSFICLQSKRDSSSCALRSFHKLGLCKSRQARVQTLRANTTPQTGSGSPVNTVERIPRASRPSKVFKLCSRKASRK